MGGLERRLQRLETSIGEDDRQAQHQRDWAVMEVIATDPEAMSFWPPWPPATRSRPRRCPPLSWNTSLGR